MKQKAIIVILLSLIAGVIWVATAQGWVFDEKGENSYSGSIEGTMVPIQSELNGKVTEILVREGQLVEAGMVIAKLDDRAVQIALVTAESQVNQAEAKLADLLGGARAQEIRRYQANVKQATAGLEQIQASQQQLKIVIDKDLQNHEYEEKLLKDAQALYEEGSITKRELDAQTHKRNLAKTQYDSSKAQYEGLQAQLKSSKAQVASAQSNLDLALEGVSKPTIEAQKAAVKGAQEAVRLAKLNQEKTVIKAPLAGVILHKHIQPGQVVNPGARLVTLLNSQDEWIKVYVPEAELTGLTEGSSADIFVDAYPDKTYKGEIVQISEVAEFTPKNVQTKEERTTIVFGVKVQVTEGLEQLRPGMPADVVFK